MSKMDKILLGIGVVILVLGSIFIYMLFTNPVALTGTNTSSAPSPPPEITYDEQNGFVPKEITVNLGETVTFVNNRSQPMWVASDPHPMHTNYEEFDTAKTLGGNYPEPGEDFSFTFDKPGTWRYHDHADPEMTGIVIVR